MDEAQIVGYAVSIVITLGAFIAVIMKFVQPINDLRVVIQKLNDNIDVLKKDNESQHRKLDKHSDEIEALDKRVGTIETKMDMYHKNN